MQRLRERPVSKRKTLEFCGAFEGRVAIRKGETPEQAAERAQDAIQKAIDDHAKRYDVNLAVDFGDIRVEAD